MATAFNLLRESAAMTLANGWTVFWSASVGSPTATVQATKADGSYYDFGSDTVRTDSTIAFTDIAPEDLIIMLAVIAALS